MTGVRQGLQKVHGSDGMKADTLGQLGGEGHGRWTVVRSPSSSGTRHADCGRYDLEHVQPPLTSALGRCTCAAPRRGRDGG
jgi:hypothetical protein